MQVTKRTHLQARLQNTLFMVLLVIVIGLIAWLSTRYEIKADWTVNNRHTLSEASQKLLDELSDPITITAYASNDNNLRKPIKDLVERYQRHKSDISLHFVDPFTVPGEVQERGIQVDGELIIYYQERSEHIREMPSEQDFTSALQRVARTDKRLIVFLEGHGERSPTQDLSKWAQVLKDRGFEVQSLNFGETPKMPSDTQVLVIATPRKQLLPGEISAITDYIDKGGNLLWFLEPTVSLQGLEPVAEKFGLTRLAGMIVDPSSQLLGIDNPAVVPITSTGYGHHPITAGFEQYLTLFPQSVGLAVAPPEGWEETILLKTHPQAWSETGELEGTIQYNEETDINGPLNIAFALVRDKSAPETEKKDESETTVAPEMAEDSEKDMESPPQKQRIIFVGDGDFLSNTFVGYAGNLDFGVKMMNWLAEDDTFIQIPIKTAVDLSLELSSNTVILLIGFFLVILPLALISTGILIWLRRRKA